MDRIKFKLNELKTRIALQKAYHEVRKDIEQLEKEFDRIGDNDKKGKEKAWRHMQRMFDDIKKDIKDKSDYTSKNIKVENIKKQQRKH